MAEPEVRHADGNIEHPTVRYERTDASFRWILSLLLGALVFAGVVFLAILWFFHDYNDYQSNLKKSSFPLAPGPAKTLGTLPPEPRLEQVDRLRESEAPNASKGGEAKERMLGTYGTIQGETGFIHVPIDEAMKYLAGKLPARAEKTSGSSRANGLVDGGESNSGRMFRGKPQWSGQ